MSAESVGIYLHVPYCRVACPYCDFVKQPLKGDAPDAFVDAVCREIESYHGPAHAQSIFLGGGTPSLLSDDAMVAVFDRLRARFDVEDSAEISIEVNPDDVTQDKLHRWRDLGVNRISLGVQSFDDEVLRFLGRCHDAELARRASDLVGEAFNNWGIDLIFGGKPADAWDATLTEMLRFAPPHVSTYALTYEERTPFWNHRHEAIADDDSLALYERAMDRLSDYTQYEVSNFARPGYESLHNQIYWRNESYAGFGPGAVSYLEGVRARNLSRIATYLERPGEKEESSKLLPHEERVETLIQHFRTRDGIGKHAYRARFGSEIEDDFDAELKELVRRGLIEDDGAGYRPTRSGFALNNEIGLVLV